MPTEYFTPEFVWNEVKQHSGDLVSILLDAGCGQKDVHGEEAKAEILERVHEVLAVVHPKFVSISHSRGMGHALEHVRDQAAKVLENTLIEDDELVLPEQYRKKIALVPNEVVGAFDEALRNLERHHDIAQMFEAGEYPLEDEARSVSE